MRPNAFWGSARCERSVFCCLRFFLGGLGALDGDDAVTLEERELAEARWFDRTEVPVMDDNTSLTSAMVRAFAEGKEREYLEG